MATFADFPGTDVPAKPKPAVPTVPALAWEDACPATSGELYDYIELDGVRSPGVVRLSGHKREQNIDVKEAGGLLGAVTTWKGTKVGKFTATFTLIYDPGTGFNDFVLWDEFSDILKSTIPPKSGRRPIAKDISHPDLQRNGFKKAILLSIGELVHDGKGGATVAVDFLEYFPPKTVSVAGVKDSRVDTALDKFNSAKTAWNNA